MPMRRRGARDQGGADWIAQDSCCVTQMEFAEAIMEDPHKTLEEVLDESGLRGQAKVSVHGEDIVKVFAMFDHDSTTKISFRNLARVEGLGEDDEELQDIINRSDKDGDDEIDFDGFCRLMKKQGWQL